MTTERILGFDSGDVDCRRCGKTLHLYFNGGELDRKECCGLVYRTVQTGVELVIEPADGARKRQFVEIEPLY